MEKTKNILIIVLFLIIALLYTCGVPNHHLDPKVVYKDSIIENRDTIWVKDTLYKFKTYKPIAKDSIRIKEYTIVDHGPCNYKRFYQDSLVDSNLIIFNTDTVQGLLLGKNVSYKLKVPKTIIITKEIIKTPVVNKKSKFFIGGEINGNSHYFGLSPKLLLETKQENLYICGYDVVNKTINIGFATKIGKK